MDYFLYHYLLDDDNFLNDFFFDMFTTIGATSAIWRKAAGLRICTIATGSTTNKQEYEWRQDTPSTLPLPLLLCLYTHCDHWLLID